MEAPRLLHHAKAARTPWKAARFRTPCFRLARNKVQLTAARTEQDIRTLAVPNFFFFVAFRGAVKQVKIMSSKKIPGLFIGLDAALSLIALSWTNLLSCIIF